MGRKKLPGGRTRTSLSVPLDVAKHISENGGVGGKQNTSAIFTQWYRHNIMEQNDLDIKLADADREIAEIDSQINALAKARIEWEAKFAREAGGSRTEIRRIREEQKIKGSVEAEQANHLEGWTLIENNYRRRGEGWLKENARLLKPYNLDVRSARSLLSVGRKPQILAESTAEVETYKLVVGR
jgi:hypothetical protein